PAGSVKLVAAGARARGRNLLHPSGADLGPDPESCLAAGPQLQRHLVGEPAGEPVWVDDGLPDQLWRGVEFELPLDSVGHRLASYRSISPFSTTGVGISLGSATRKLHNKIG